jgi:hypothetical protein
MSEKPVPSSSSALRRRSVCLFTLPKWLFRFSSPHSRLFPFQVCNSAMVIVTTTRTTASGGSASMTSPFAITTTFTAPSACAQATGGLTILENKKYEIWLNEPVPVPGTTITSCYPSQFISSYLLEKGGITQAAFSPLVCPSGYATQGPFTSNYIACCPRSVPLLQFQPKSDYKCMSTDQTSTAAGTA